jgi:hypothetical protein
MEIAPYTALSQSSLFQAVGVQVMKMQKQQIEQQSQGFVQMLERSVQPNLGSNLDVKV